MKNRCVSLAGKKSGWDLIRAVVVSEKGGLYIYIYLLFVFTLSSNLGCREEWQFIVNRPIVLVNLKLKDIMLGRCILQLCTELVHCFSLSLVFKVS